VDFVLISFLFSFSFFLAFLFSFFLSFFLSFFFFVLSSFLSVVLCQLVTCVMKSYKPLNRICLVITSQHRYFWYDKSYAVSFPAFAALASVKWSFVK